MRVEGGDAVVGMLPPSRHHRTAARSRASLLVIVLLVVLVLQQGGGYSDVSCTPATVMDSGEACCAAPQVVPSPHVTAAEREGMRPTAIHIRLQ